jgi:hypothetical protein
MGTGYEGAEITASAQKQFTEQYVESGGREAGVADGRGFIG